MNFREGIRGMKEKQLDLNEAINFLLYSILFCLPFIINPYGDDTYYFPKVIFLWMISFFILVLFILKKDYKLNLNCKIAIGFIVIYMVSTITSNDILKSVIGDKMDYNGLITHVCYIIVFIAANKYLKINKQYIKVFLFLGAIMSIYGIFQYYGYDVIPRDGFHMNIKECYGTIGHRNFFSTYLLIFLSISISSFIFWRDRVCYLYSLIYFGALIGTKTRGGWLTLGGICLIGLIFIVRDIKKLLRATIIVVSFISIFFVMDYFKGGEVKVRLETIKEDITKITPSSGSGRVAIYKGAMIVIEENPILGVGPSRFWEGLVEELPKKSEFWWQNGRVIVDSAHNEILHYAATTGILSAIIYIILVIVILVKLLKKIYEDKIKILFLIIVGYIVQANFNISIISVAPLFWIFLGLASSDNIEERVLEIDK